MAAREQNVRVVVLRQEKFEADRACIAHHLVVERLLSVKLAWLELLCWLRQLLLVPLFQLGRHAGKELVDHFWLVAVRHMTES